jgi:queuine tRNA-ribosyltransferase
VTRPSPNLQNAMNASFQIGVPTREGGRTGQLQLAHGEIETPTFMPVGTYGTVRGLAPRELEEAGTQILLANAYHLALRPGAETISNLGGLHRFMGWDRPILTDSGGYQLFSLAEHVKINEDGAVLRSPIDGTKTQLTPESVVAIELALGVDVGMVFDALEADGTDRDRMARAADRTLRWARRARTASEKAGAAAEGTAFFAIMQGGLFEDLRRANADALAELDFPGYAVGGLSVGEDHGETMRVGQASAAMLPVHKPRYMMGMGTPIDLVWLAGWGYDLFDCVIPTRNARNGHLFTRDGVINIRNASHKLSTAPVEEGCDCYCCGRFGRGYLHHLAKRGEMLVASMASLHNVTFYQRLMGDIRAALAADDYERFRGEFLARYNGDTA